MPDQNTSQNPSSSPSGEAAVPPPIAGEQRAVAKTDSRDPSQEGEAEKHLLRSVKNGELALIVINAVLVILTGVIACIYSGQLRQMKIATQEATKATRASQESAYAACIGTQTTQATLLQIQKGAADSHAVAAATVEQAIAGIEAERSLMTLVTRIPAQNEVFNGVLGIPYVIKNEGKSGAVDFEIRAKAVFIKGEERIFVRDSAEKMLSGKYLPSGYEFPDKPSDSNHRALTFTIPVQDIKGNKVPAPSQVATDFMNGDGGEVEVFGRLNYADFAGTHEERFCQVLDVVKVGFSHDQSVEEHACANYNRRADEYKVIPSLHPQDDKTAVMKFQPITCEVPKQ